MTTLCSSVNFFIWQDEYETGDTDIDEQHRTIVETVNILNHACVTGSSEETVRRIMRDLFDFSQYHFFTEERQLLLLNGTAYHKHKREHEQILRFLRTNCERDLSSQELRHQMCTLVRKVYARHMYSSDKRDIAAAQSAPEMVAARKRAGESRAD